MTPISFDNYSHFIILYNVSYYQTLLFLNPWTLRGEKLEVYILAKILKHFTGADVTSYQVLITKHRVMKFIELFVSLNGR